LLKPRCICRLAILFALLAATAAAQQNLTDWSTVKALATGADVRVTTSSRTVRGKILRTTDESLVLASGKSQEMFPQQDVKRILLRGDSHRGRNSLIGLASGAALGAIIGAAAHQDCTGWCIFNTSRGADAAGGAIGLGGIGAIVGALIPSRSWLEVYRK
jgi:hypothetical protein